MATLGREVVFALSLGSGADLEIFRLAFGAPNMMGQSLAPAFVGVMLPLLAHAAAQSPEAERRMRRRIIRFNFLGVFLLCTLGFVAAQPLAQILAPGYQPPAVHQVANQLRILWLFFGLTGLSFTPRVFLNHRDIFWPGASTSLVISLAFVLGGFGIASGNLPQSATTLSWAAVVGGAALLLLQLQARPYSKQDFFFWRKTASPQPPLLFPLLGALLATVSASAPRFLDRAFASSMPSGSIAALEYSYNVLAAPGILLGTSFVMIAFPAFSRGVASQKARAAAKKLHKPLMLTAGLAFLISVGVHFFAEPLVQLFYLRGAFAQADAAATSQVLRWQSLGMMPMVVGMVLAQGLLGLQLVRWVVFLSFLRIFLRWLALLWLIPRWGLSGLGSAYAITETLALIVGVILFRRKLAATDPE